MALREHLAGSVELIKAFWGCQYRHFAYFLTSKAIRGDASLWESFDRSSSPEENI